MYNSTSGHSMPQLVAPPRDDGNVTAAIMESDKLQHVLNEQLDALEVRISPVLRPSPPRTANQTPGNAPAPVRCGLADGIALQNARLQNLIDHVNDLLARCDL